MRLDKFLKVSRLIKRRTLAKEVSESERVLVNGKIAKPSKDLKIGDIITIEFGMKMVSVKVLSLDISIICFRLSSFVDNNCFSFPVLL